MKSNLVLCGESEEDLRVIMGRLVKVRKIRVLKGSADRSMGRIEGSVDGVSVNGRLEGVPEFPVR